MKDVFIAKILNNRLTVGSESNEVRFREFLKRNKNKNVRIEIEKPSRSRSQNNFYWLYLGIIERETGNNSEDLHEYFKRIFLPPNYIKVFGKEVKIPNSTTKLNKVEFGEYLEKICARTGVPIPDPIEAGFTPDWYLRTKVK